MSSKSPEPTLERGRVAEISSVIGGSIAGAAIAYAFATNVVPSFLLSDDVSKLIWYAIRVSGVGAYVLLWATTVAGICMSGGIGGKKLNPLIYPLHQLGDRFAGFTPASIAIPFISTYRPIPNGLGIISLYASAIVFWSVEVRPRIGYQSWKRIHYLAFVAYGLALVHGIFTGTDSDSWAMRLTYLVTGQLVIVLAGMRIAQVFAKRGAQAKAAVPHRRTA